MTKHDPNYFLKLNGILVLGILAIALSFVVLIFFVPHIISLGQTGIIATLLFLVVWLVIYVGLIIGGVVMYFFSPLHAPAKKSSRARSRKKRH